MIPLRDVIPTRTRPVITIALIAANVLVFALQLAIGDAVDDFILYFGLVPGHFSWWTLFTSMFLHGSLLHAAGNMLYLWIFGENVEDRMGHVRFLIFYLLCGGTAALVQVAANPDSLVPVIGTTGVLAGVMGAYFILYPRSRVITLVPLFVSIQAIEVPAIWFLCVWFLIQIASGLGSIATVSRQSSGGITLWGQMAGLLAGVTGLFVFRRPERLRVEWWDVYRTGNAPDGQPFRQDRDRIF